MGQSRIEREPLDFQSNEHTFYTIIPFDKLINSLQSSKVGYQGIEPRYLKMLNFTGNKHLFVAYHYIILPRYQLFEQHSYYSIALIKDNSNHIASWATLYHLTVYYQYTASITPCLSDILLHLKYSISCAIRILQLKGL